MRRQYDPRSNATDVAAQDLRAGRAPVGVQRMAHGTAWTWGCRCGAWTTDDRWNTREFNRREYREHQQRCPLRMGLSWDPEREQWL